MWAVVAVLVASAAIGLDESGNEVHVKPRSGTRLLRGKWSLDRCPQNSNDFSIGATDLDLSEKYLCLGQKWDWPEITTPKWDEGDEKIPRLVHIVLTDRGTRPFDWTCWLSLKAVKNHLRPTTIMVHLLDAVEPWSAWWREVKKMPEVRIMPFTADDIPKELNGHSVHLAAHLSDFRRFQMMYEHGGVYIDTDMIYVRPVDELLKYEAVWGRQG